MIKYDKISNVLCLARGFFLLNLYKQKWRTQLLPSDRLHTSLFPISGYLHYHRRASTKRAVKYPRLIAIMDEAKIHVSRRPTIFESIETRARAPVHSPLDEISDLVECTRVHADAKGNETARKVKTGTYLRPKRDDDVGAPRNS